MQRVDQHYLANLLEVRLVTNRSTMACGRLLVGCTMMSPNSIKLTEMQTGGYDHNSVYFFLYDDLKRLLTFWPKIGFNFFGRYVVLASLG